MIPRIPSEHYYRTVIPIMLQFYKKNLLNNVHSRYKTGWIGVVSVVPPIQSKKIIIFYLGNYDKYNLKIKIVQLTLS